MALIDTLKQKLAEARERFPFLDHLILMMQHYGRVKGNALAGAVTYFGFLSFFPILALAFAVVGVVSTVYDVEDQLVKGIQGVLPMVTSENPAPSGELSIAVFQKAAGAAAGVGAIGVLYSGLGWVSGLRQALLLVFEKPAGEQPNFFVGKFKDLVSLALIGLTMIVSVGVAGVLGAVSKQLWDLVSGLLQIETNLSWLLQLIAILIGLGANMVLFYAVFRLLADPPTPKKSLWSGALLGAIGFEVLKKGAIYLLALTKSQPAFAVFGISLILVIWINYFSRVVMYAASWAHTAPAALALREVQGELVVAGPQLDLAAAAASSPVAAPEARTRGSSAKAFVAGAATTVAASAVGAAAWLRRGKP